MAATTQLPPQEVSILQFNRDLLERDQLVMSVEELKRLASKHGVPESHVAALEACGAIAKLDNVAVHLHPAALCLEAHALHPDSTSVATTLDWDPCASLRATLRDIDTKIAAAKPAYDETVLRAAKRRRTLWGAAVAAGGTQLAVISRLTYFDLDWDIMEPVSYFIGTGTSLAFFLYMLKFGAECTPRFFDETVAAKHAQHDAVVVYLSLVDERNATIAAIEAKEAWFRCREQK